MMSTTTSGDARFGAAVRGTMTTFRSGTAIAPPPRSRVEGIEAWALRKFPPSFVRFLSEYNGGTLESGEIQLKWGSFYLEKFLPIVDDINSSPRGIEDLEVIASQLDWALSEDEESESLDLIPIASAFAGNYVMLDYRRNEHDPEVVYWDHEKSTEFMPVTYEIARSFSEFLELLQSNWPIKETR